MEAQLKRGNLLRPQVYKRVRISPVEVYNRVGKSVILVCKKTQKGSWIHFMSVKKLRNHSGFVIYSYFKDSAFTAVLKCLSSKLGM